MKLIDMTGQRFGRLMVITRRGTSKHGMVLWECVCDCGKTTIVVGLSLKDGRTKSCGCLMREMRIQENTTHGMSRSPEYGAWSKMKERCYVPASNRYHTHGARGIRVCDEWINDFARFFSDVGPRPSVDHSLDRIDNNGHYEPSNCRWATNREQSRNTRRNRWLTFNGRTMTLTDWSADIGVSIPTLRMRLKAGWDVEKALTQPVRHWPSQSVTRLQPPSAYRVT